MISWIAACLRFGHAPSNLRSIGTLPRCVSRRSNVKPAPARHLGPASRKFHLGRVERLAIDPERVVLDAGKELELGAETDEDFASFAGPGPPPLSIGDLAVFQSGTNLVCGVILQVASVRHSRFPEFRALLATGRLRSHFERVVILQIPGWAFGDSVRKRFRGETKNTAPSFFSQSDEVTLTLLRRVGLPDHLSLSIEEFQKFVSDSHRRALDEGKFAKLYGVFAKLKGFASISVDRAARFAFYGQAASEEEVFGTSGRSGSEPKFEPTPAELVATMRFLLQQDHEFFLVRQHGGRQNKTGQGVSFGFESESYAIDTLRVKDFLGLGFPRERKPGYSAFLSRMNTLIERRRGLVGRVASLSEDELNPIFLPTDRRLLLAAMRGLRRRNSTPFLQTLAITRGLAQFYAGKALSDAGKVLQLARDTGLVPPWDEAQHRATAIAAVALAGRESSPTTEMREELSVWYALLQSWSEIWGKRLLGNEVVRELQPDVHEHLGRKSRKSRLPGHELDVDVSSVLSGVRHETDVLRRLRSESVFPKDGLEETFSKGQSTSTAVVDAHSGVRERYCDRVYVIDDPTAHELDDGIAIAPCDDGNPDLSPWLEMHIADPTTWFGPDHPLSLFAQQRWTSIYLPSGHVPMLPDAATVRLLDLRERKEQSTTYALTFSGRLDLRTGDLAEYRVRCTLLENVKITSYSAVDGVLAPRAEADRTDGATSMWATSVFPNVPRKIVGDLTTQDRKNLENIYALAKRHLEFRTACGAYQPDQIEYSVSTAPQWLEPAPFPFPPARPIWPFKSVNPPSVRLKQGAINWMSPAHVVVSECMIMAGRIAAKFCQDNDIPTIYRGQPSILQAARENGRVVSADPALGGEFRVDPNSGYPPTEQLESVVHRVMSTRRPKTGLLDFLEINKLLPYMPPSTASIEPIAHYSMGLGGVDNPTASKFLGYTRVTSPLRRYADMLLHWNIKAHLLGRPLPYSKEDLQKLLTRGLAIERITKRSQETADHYWALEWIRRREVLARLGKDPMKTGADAAAKTTMPHVDPPSTVPYAINRPSSFVPAQILAPYKGQMKGEPDLPARSEDPEKWPVYQAMVTAVAKFDAMAQVVLIDLAGVVATLIFDGGIPMDGDEIRAPVRVGDRIRVVVTEVKPYFGVLQVREIEAVKGALARKPVGVSRPRSKL